MNASKKRIIITGIIAFTIIVIGVGGAYFITSEREVAIDTSTIDAPLIDLTVTTPGILAAVYVHEGDRVAANEPVARVGTQVITAKVAGLVVKVNDTVGAPVSSGEAVVEMIDPSALRVVGKIDENKGLADIAVGDAATFTVDAFGSRSFKGVVDEVAPTSNQSGVVFNISGSRQVEQFDVKVRFDTGAYPELKNGMSARLWIYRQ